MCLVFFFCYRFCHPDYSQHVRQGVNYQSIIPGLCNLYSQGDRRPASELQRQPHHHRLGTSAQPGRGRHPVQGALLSPAKGGYRRLQVHLQSELYRQRVRAGYHLHLFGESRKVFVYVCVRCTSRQCACCGCCCCSSFLVSRGRCSSMFVYGVRRVSVRVVVVVAVHLFW